MKINTVRLLSESDPVPKENRVETSHPHQTNLLTHDPLLWETGLCMFVLSDHACREELRKEDILHGTCFLTNVSHRLCGQAQPAQQDSGCPHSSGGEGGGGRCSAPGEASYWPAPSVASGSHLEANKTNGFLFSTWLENCWHDMTQNLNQLTLKCCNKTMELQIHRVKF